MKVVVNVQSTEDHETNAGIPQGSFLFNFWLSFINNPPKNILKSMRIIQKFIGVPPKISMTRSWQLILPLTFALMDQWVEGMACKVSIRTKSN